MTRAVDRFGNINSGFTAAQHNLIHVSAARCVKLRIC
jgi:hypothetical protein